MTRAGEAPRFEILDHTADIGLRARGTTLEELFENAAHGLAAILDRATTAPGAEPLGLEVDLESGDVEGLLVTWLDEILFLLQERDACLAELRVRQVGPTKVRGELHVARCADVPQGTELKATTYHQLAVGDDGEAHWATVYFDV
jgi:SHS2 domain-containing protein